MRSVIYSLIVSLDGYISRPDGALDWVIVDEELHTFFNDQQREIDTYLYGRRMYDLMAAFWPSADADPSAPTYIAEFARIWREMPKVVFSKALETVEWNARLAGGDLAGEVSELKARPGKNMAIRGPSIAAAFMELGLIDECRGFVQPVVLGAGRPMFPASSKRLNLQLAETRTFDSGIVYLRYQTKRTTDT